MTTHSQVQYHTYYDNALDRDPVNIHTCTVHTYNRSTNTSNTKQTTCKIIIVLTIC